VRAVYVSSFIQLTSAVRLKDLVVRTETNKLVTDLVNLDRVRSLLRMISLRRRFKVHMRMRMEQQGNFYYLRHLDRPLTQL
jgi:hypothetical protein